MTMTQAKQQESSATPHHIEFGVLNAKFKHEFVRKTEYIEIKTSAHYWKAQFKQSKRINTELKEDISNLKLSHKKELLAVKKENEQLAAKLKLREKQLFGKKSEKKCKSEKNGQSNSTTNPRGQQRGCKGHGRTANPLLPVVYETNDLPDGDKLCAACSAPFKEFGDGETSDIIEINVAAHIRRIKKPTYTPTCQCGVSPGVITAANSGRVINKGRLGVSVWTEVILSKYQYYMPHHRKIKELRDLGLNLASGTILGGLKTIGENYLTPIYDKLKERSRLASHWHADETRWQVYVKMEDKTSYRWYLWVFHSPEVIVYLLDPTRSSTVPQGHLEGCEGILSVDRYSAYKVFLKGALIILAYCWAHVRRDFLDLAKKYPIKDDWAMTWVEKIGELYFLNSERLNVKNDKVEYEKRHGLLVESFSNMEALYQEQATKLSEIKERTTAEEACFKVLTSLNNHWSGLSVFIDHPEIPMDNNTAENDLRSMVVLRKNCRGSGSLWSGECLVMLCSIFKTLELHNINVRTWLTVFLQACADAGSQLPDKWEDNFLPWKMSAEKIKVMTAPIANNDTS